MKNSYEDEQLTINSLHSISMKLGGDLRFMV